MVAWSFSFLFGEKVASNCQHNLQSFYYHPNWIWSAVPVSSLLVKSVPHKNGGAEVLVSLEEFVCKLDRCRLWKEDKFCDQNLTCKQYPSLFHPKHLKLCWAKLYYRRIYFGRVNRQGLTGLTTEYLLGWCSPEEVDLGKAVFGKKIILCLH